MKVRRQTALKTSRRATLRKLEMERCEERVLMAIFVVTNNADSGAGSLRDAIDSANSNNQADTIQFNLANDELLIRPQTALPAFSEAQTILDATTQPGYAGAPLVEISGQDLPTNTVALSLTGGRITIKGLVINRFAGAAGTGISIEGAGNNTIVGNYIGTDRTGSVASANGGYGIFVNAVSNNVIGGTTAADRNVISGNTADGIHLFAAGASANLIQGNYIGLNAAGTQAIGNGASGVIALTGANNTIGGTTPGAGNVISGNNGGVLLQSTGAQGTFVQGNFIGTDATGTQKVGNTFTGLTILGSGGNSIGGPTSGARNVISGNGRTGITIQGSTSTLNQIKNNAIGTDLSGTLDLGNASEGVWNFGGVNNFIGGLVPGEGNVIANNGAFANNDGVYINGGSGVQVVSNSIYNNAGLGINISEGSNNGITAPTITRAETGGGFTNIVGTFNGAANASYIVQFFTSPTADPSGFGEGRTLLQPTGSTTGVTINTNGSGVGFINVRLPVATNLDDLLTSTITRTAIGDTSEFSAVQAITEAPLADLRVSIAATTNPPLLGANINYQVDVLNRTGSDTSSASVLTVTLDPSLTLVSVDAPFVLVGSDIQINIGSLGANVGQTVNIVATPSRVGSVTSTATIAGVEIDPVTGNNSATSTINIQPASNLAISVSAPSTSPIGGDLTFVINGSNAGPSVANGVKVEFTIPANTTFVSSDLSVPGNTPPPQNGILTATIGTLPVGPGGNFTLRVTIRPNAVGPLSVPITISATENDTDVSNNTVTQLVTVVPASELAVSVTSSPNPILVGDPMTYTVTVTNNGPSPATGVILTSVIDATLANVATSAGTYDSTTNTVTATAPTIAVGGTYVLTITATPTVSKQIQIVATVTNPNEPDTSPGNNTTTVVNPVSPIDLVITGNASPSPSLVGQNLTFTYTVVNNGPAPATNVVFTQTLPGTVTLVSTSPSSGLNEVGTTITLPIGTLAPGASRTVTIVVRPTVAGPLSTTASVNATETDTNPANNSLTLSSIASPIDLVVTNTASPSSPIIGDNATFTMTIVNNGPTTATNVRLTDSLSGSYELVSASANLGTVTTGPGGVILSLNSLASGASATLTVIVRSSNVGTVSSTATATATEFDTNSGNNTVQASANFINTPGLLQFSSPTFSVNENGGSATITVSRTRGNLGAVSINYTTVDGSAIAGVNYRSTQGTVNFAAGETSKSFTIPIIADGQITPNLNFFVALNSPAGGAALGSQSSATVTIINTDLDLVSPTVTSVQPITSGGTVGAFLLTYSEAVTPESAGLFSNYALFVSGRDNGAGIDQSIPISSVIFNSSTNQVAIIPASPLPLNTFYKVVVNGNAPNGVSDIYGNLLDGRGDGGTATSFLGYAAVGTRLSYVDANNDLVNLRLTGGGNLSLTRTGDGEGVLLQLSAVRGRARQVLSGSVRRLGLQGDGRTTINTLAGIGAFGDVFVSMRTPPFYVPNVSGFRVQSVRNLVPRELRSKAVPKGPRAKFVTR